MAVKNDLKKPVAENKAGFPIPEGNYKMILIGFAIVVLGFILMMGGGSEDPNQFNYDIFSFRRITLAPIVVLVFRLLIGGQIFLYVNNQHGAFQLCGSPYDIPVTCPELFFDFLTVYFAF